MTFIDPPAEGPSGPHVQLLALPAPAAVPDTCVAEPEQKSRAARALKFVKQEYRLVYSTDKTGYAVDDSTPNPQAWRIDSPGFASAVRRLAYIKDPTLILTQDDQKEIGSQLEALTELTGQPSPVSLRIAQTDRGVEIDVARASADGARNDPLHDRSRCASCWGWWIRRFGTHSMRRKGGARVYSGRGELILGEDAALDDREQAVAVL